MADDLEKTQEREPRNRFEMIMAYLRSLTDNEEELEELKEKEPSIAELINFGGKYRKKSEGGLLDEGGEVDEKSGNDVPIGGTKEGVRDDIPAMLSEGEFVFPEDVTRYHGLEKLMTLRQEAKMGLKKMEAMGQMGNSEEATIPDDLPFTMDDLILVVGEEADEKDDKPIKAQAGTFVPSQQNIANVGVTGTQQSMYQQPNTIQPATPLTPPASSLVPVVQVPQAGGYSAPTVLAEQVEQPNFVPEPSDIYKPVKYINPTSGETMTINEYQGNPVSAVPAGFIRYDDYIASGGKDPNEDTDVDTGVETTSVETAKVAGAQDDERKAKISNLDKMKEDRERKRVQEYNRVFDIESKSFTDKNDPNYITDDQLIDAYKDQMEAETIGAGLSVFAGPIGLLPRLGRGKVNKALAERFGENWRERPEFKDITRGSVLKETGSEIIQGFKDAFDPEFYDNYKAKYDVKSYDTTRTGTGFNLSAREQQSFDNAVDRGDDAVANHFSLVAQSRAAKDTFARRNAKDIQLAQAGGTEGAAALERLMSDRQVGNTRLGEAAIKEIIEFGSSTTTAIKMGKAEQGKGLFGKATPTDNTPITSKDEGPSLAQKLATKAAEDRKQELADAAAAKAARDKLAKEARDRRRNDRTKSFTPPKPKPKPTKTDRFGRSRQVSRAQQMAVQGINKGGLMKGKK